MSVVDRKLCAGCGEPNLSSDIRCWACGGSNFAPLNARLAGEPTVCLGNALEVTQEWERERPRWAPLAYLGSAVVFALFMWVVGYWIGRSSTTEPPVAQAPTAVAQPVMLPTPPTQLSAVPPTFSTAPAPAPAAPSQASAADPAPSVRVKTVPGRMPTSARVPTSPAAPPTTVVFPPVRPQASSPARVTTIYSYTTEPTPLPPVQPRIPAPTAHTSVVSLRNDTGSTIDVTFEGSETRTARVSSGSILPLTMPPGSYQVRVSSGQAAPGRTSALLVEGRSYSLAVAGRGEGDSARLVITEPGLE